MIFLYNAYVLLIDKYFDKNVYCIMYKSYIMFIVCTVCTMDKDSYISVRNVKISTISDVEVDFGNIPQIPQFTIDGGRPPHEVTLTKPDGTVSTIYSDSVTGNCEGSFAKKCNIKMDASSYEQDGRYTVTAKNRAAQNKVVADMEEFNITVYKDVETKISFKVGSTLIPYQDSLNLLYGVQLTVICLVDGGRMPSQVEMRLGNQSKTEVTLTFANYLF